LLFIFFEFLGLEKDKEFVKLIYILICELQMYTLVETGIKEDFFFLWQVMFVIIRVIIIVWKICSDTTYALCKREARKHNFTLIITISQTITINTNRSTRWLILLTYFSVRFIDSEMDDPRINIAVFIFATHSHL